MGILDSILGSLLGGSNASPGMSNVLSDILGGGNQPTMNQAGVGNQSGGNVQGTAGGLGNLISMFEGAGLGNVVQSWIGTGPNSPVSTTDLQNVFGNLIPGMAQKAGMDQGDFLNQLSQHLPNAVNGMTPDGQVPSNASVDV